jgi:hypothetical protein
MKPLTLKQILLEKAETTYTITQKLFRLVSDGELSWKPASGKNWMTVGQLLMHCANFGCGKAIQGFVKGDWEMLDNEASQNSDEVEHIPPASALPTVKTVKEALELLEKDRKVAQSCINEVDEDDLLIGGIIAPWGGPELSLFQQLLLMMEHLAQHKGQLFYYLKLMGKKVNTADLWGV